MTSVLFYEFLELSDSLFSGAKTASGHGNKSLLHGRKYMDRLSLLKLNCCNMQSWVQWGVVKELAMVETRKAESRMGSRWTFHKNLQIYMPIRGIGSCFSSIVARRFWHSCWIWIRIQSVFSSVACRFAGSCWMWVRIESVFSSIATCRFAGSGWMWVRIGSVFSSIVACRFAVSCWMWFRIGVFFQCCGMYICRFRCSFLFNNANPILAIAPKYCVEAQ